nr:hypothetical protein [Tanacetum cinerariifolium]
MSSLFADTHNVVAMLEKSDAAEGFEQIIDFLSGSYIHYALTVSPRIYISCIKQFWNSVSVKRSGVVCLPNEEIFAGLAPMGYEKPSTKLTFYKAFFSSQWKFLIHTILQSLSAKGTYWNEFSTTMASAVICLSKGQRFNFSKYIFDSLVRNVDNSSKFYMYPRFIQLILQAQVGDLSAHNTRFISLALTQKVFANMRRVGKGFSGVETPLFEGMIADRQPTEDELGAEQAQVDAAFTVAVVEDVVEDVAEDVAHVLDTCSALLRSVEHLEHDNVAQRLEIVKLKARVKKLEQTAKGRMMNEDEGIELVKDAKIAESEGRQADKQAEIYNIDLDHSLKVLSMQEDDSEVQDVVEVVTTAKLITKVVTATASQGSAASETIPAVNATIPAASATIHAAALTIVAAYTRRRKGVIIRDPEVELPLKTPAETPKDAAMDHVNQKSSSNPQYIKRYQGIKKRPQTESEARKNMKIYLKNTAGYKMDFFKGMTYAQICPIFQARFEENIRFLFKSREEMEAEDQEIIKSINETPAQKAAKRRKLSKEAQEAEDLRKRLEVVEDEDDDVFVEATPLAQKVLIMDYQIVLIDNKPRHKIIRADDTHQLYISFTTLLKNFDREDLETLWRIVVTIAKLITEVVTAAASQVSAVSTTIPAASVTILAAAPTIVAAYTRRRKGVIIRDPEEELPLKTPAETLKVKDKGKG